MGTCGSKAESLWGTRGVDMGNLMLFEPEIDSSAVDISYAGSVFPKNSHNLRLLGPRKPSCSPNSLHFAAREAMRFRFATPLRILAIQRFPVHLLKTA